LRTLCGKGMCFIFVHDLDENDTNVTTFDLAQPT